MNDLAQIEAAAAQIYGVMPPTPQYCWPLLCERAGTEVWVKHENHTPIGAFKVRGGLVFMADLKALRPEVAGVISATRGNHGQSVAFAARRHGLRAVLVVPHGNSVEKNRAMRALGAELIEHGHDFDAAHAHARELARREDLYLLPSFDPLLARGVATYSLEFLRGAGDLDVVYVPIGLGSGICGMIMARDALGHKAEVVGVVAAQAPAYALSLEAGRPVATNSARTLADGVAVRTPDPAAFEIIRRGAARIVKVSEAEIKAAMRAYYSDTHNLAEGAGAAPLAALLQEKDRLKGKRAGAVLSGGNVDTEVYRAVLGEKGETP